MNEYTYEIWQQSTYSNGPWEFYRMYVAEAMTASEALQQAKQEARALPMQKTFRSAVRNLKKI